MIRQLRNSRTEGVAASRSQRSIKQKPRVSKSGRRGAPLTWATPSSPFIFRVALTSYKMFLCYLLFLAGLADHFHISDGHVAVLGCVLLHVGIGGCPLSVLFEVVPCGVLYDAGGGDGVPHVIGQ